MAVNKHAGPFLQLAEGEELRLVLDSKQGLVDGPPPGEDCLLLTNRRVAAAWRDDIRQRRAAAPLGRVDGVEVTELSRDYKPLITGVLFMGVGLMVPWVAALFNLNGFIAWLLALVLVVLGAVTASAYFAREQVGVIAFKAGTLEVSMPLRSTQGVQGAYALATAYFAEITAGGAGANRPYAALSPNGGAFRWSREEPEPAVQASQVVTPAPLQEGLAESPGQGASAQGLSG